MWAKHILYMRSHFTPHSPTNLATGTSQIRYDQSAALHTKPEAPPRPALCGLACAFAPAGPEQGNSKATRPPREPSVLVPLGFCSSAIVWMSLLPPDVYHFEGLAALPVLDCLCYQSYRYLSNPIRSVCSSACTQKLTAKISVV